MRIGIGYDVHALVYGRKLVLGGVTVPFEKGLDGHSDADVLTHAIMDALLGAAGMKDIGTLFPDSSPEYAGISSLSLLKQVMDKLEKQRLKVSNMDAVIIAQSPRMAPYMDEMKRNLGRSMQTNPHRLNLKATTTERLGFIGREEGIAAQAVVLLMEEE